MFENNADIEHKKTILLKAIGKVVYQQRKLLKKGINKFSFEYDIGNGLLSRLENGTSDTKITTLWKLANAFNMTFAEFACLIEKELPADFNFYDD
ncbi:MAG: helix-turn-helix domain-containing protein [Candidatus Gastranaerophilales bacterium]|nr:helix-turn-helix domain-containing protein [Candidatus Gastranaerophilales bacterium]